MRKWWDHRSRSAGMGPAEWGNWHGVDCSIEILPCQGTGFCVIDDRVGKSGSGENRPSGDRSLHSLGRSPRKTGFRINLPARIPSTEAVPAVIMAASPATVWVHSTDPGMAT